MGDAATRGRRGNRACCAIEFVVLTFLSICFDQLGLCSPKRSVGDVSLAPRGSKWTRLRQRHGFSHARASDASAAAKWPARSAGRLASGTAWQQMNSAAAKSRVSARARKRRLGHGQVADALSGETGPWHRVTATGLGSSKATGVGTRGQATPRPRPRGRRAQRGDWSLAPRGRGGTRQRRSHGRPHARASDASAAARWLALVRT